MRALSGNAVNRIGGDSSIVQSVSSALFWIGSLVILLSGPSVAFSANVTVNATSNLFPVANTAYGVHTSVYDNQNGNSSLPSLLIESGVNTLRYPGGGYADVFHCP